MNEQYPVLKEAEPFYYEGGPTGILVIHGFTGSTQSMQPLGEAYREAGFTVCGPRLKGHGTHYEEMEKTTYQDWITSVEEGFQWLKERCERIFVTGLSMGGTLTLYLAEKYPEIKGIIPINAAIDLPAMKEFEGAKEPRFLDAIGSDIKAVGVKELAYEKTPVCSIQEILILAEQVRAHLSDITCSALVFVSKEDHVVPPENSEEIFANIASLDKEKIKLDNSYHVATLDNDQSLIIERTLNFIRTHI
ncbi:alpha/beta hydrolase [Bacillus sp. FJAT-52991]|uniref:Alpha/beta fold hydrolase n=1 Tax=Bacillus kandeliae TaxID=3129297 RepID=A0ABZ2N602_9BACI